MSRERLNYGSDIPGARAIIEQVINDNTLQHGHKARLQEALAKMTRRRPVKVAPRQTKPVTAEVRAEIRRIAAENPDWTMQQIGTATDTNSGRVSEVLNGLR